MIVLTVAKHGTHDQSSHGRRKGTTGATTAADRPPAAGGGNRIPADQDAINDAYDAWAYHDGVAEIRAGAENVLGTHATAYDTGMGQRDVVEPLLGLKPMPNEKLRAAMPEVYDAKMAGIEQARSQGRHLLRGVRDGAPYPGELYRGIDPTYDNGFHAKLRRGDTFDVSLMSTTPDRSFASSFSGGLMMTVLPGAKTTHSTEDRYLGSFQQGGKWVQGPLEEVTGGRFEVVARTPKSITVRQVAVFDPDQVTP